MKALSVRQPYASEILSGEKTREYRSRRTSYRGPLLICASQAADEGATPDMPRGVAVCLVDVVDCEADGEGGFAWVLENPRPVEPRPIKGALGFFEVPDVPLLTPTRRKSEAVGPAPAGPHSARIEQLAADVGARLARRGG